MSGRAASLDRRIADALVAIWDTSLLRANFMIAASALALTCGTDRLNLSVPAASTRRCLGRWSARGLALFMSELADEFQKSDTALQRESALS